MWKKRKYIIYQILSNIEVSEPHTDTTSWVSMSKDQIISTFSTEIFNVKPSWESSVKKIERGIYLNDDNELIGGTKSSGVTLKEVGGKKCYQIDKEQYITITTTPTLLYIL